MPNAYYSTRAPELHALDSWNVISPLKRSILISQLIFLNTILSLQNENHWWLSQKFGTGRAIKIVFLSVKPWDIVFMQSNNSSCLSITYIKNLEHTSRIIFRGFFSCLHGFAFEIFSETIVLHAYLCLLFQVYSRIFERIKKDTCPSGLNVLALLALTLQVKAKN